MLFTLADLYTKVLSGQWLGKISFYPSDKCLDVVEFEQHCLTLDDALDAICKTNKGTSTKGPLAFSEPVLVEDDPSPETLMNMLYLWHKGYVVVPVRHTMSHQAKVRIGQDCHARFCLNKTEVTQLETTPDSDLAPNFDNAIDQQTGTSFNIKSTRRVTGVDLALIIYTSGSTGNPKGIMLSHANVLAAMCSIGKYLDLYPQEHILCLSPLSFDYGLYQLLFSLAFDCDLTLYEEDFHPIKVIKAIEKNEISLLPLVPAMASALTKMIQTFKKPLPSLKKMTNTGGHLAEETIVQLTTLLPQLDVYAMYGLTECKRALYLPPQDSLRKLGSVGLPMPGLEAKIFHRNLAGENQHSVISTEVLGKQYFEEVEQGDIGELFVRGASLMQGYFGLANTGASIVSGQYREDNWLATGDLFSQDQDGYFYFKGRSKDLIKQAGFCLYPAELESQIEQNENVFLCAVVPHKDKWGDEIACLNVQLIESSETHQKAFQSWLAQQLDVNYRPRQLVFIDEIALTQNSKVDKQRLIANLSLSTSG